MTSSQNSANFSQAERQLNTLFSFKKQRHIDAAQTRFDIFAWHQVDAHTRRDIGMEGATMFTVIHA